MRLLPSDETVHKETMSEAQHIAIKVTAFCPCCHQEVRDKRIERGILINRRASLGSEIILTQTRLKLFDPKKEALQLAQAKAKLNALEQELRELPQIDHED